MKATKKISTALLFVLALVACSPSYKEGTYTGSSTGYNKDKPIKLEVTINKDKKISNVKILEEAETDEIGSIALQILSKATVESGKNDVDSITGATMTSKAFNEAVELALEEAKK